MRMFSPVPALIRRQRSNPPAFASPSAGSTLPLIPVKRPDRRQPQSLSKPSMRPISPDEHVNGRTGLSSLSRSPSILPLPSWQAYLIC